MYRQFPGKEFPAGVATAGSTDETSEGYAALESLVVSEHGFVVDHQILSLKRAVTCRRVAYKPCHGQAEAAR